MAMPERTAAPPPRAERFRGIRVLEVVRAERLTPAMMRVTIGGVEMEGFGSGPNVKLLFPPFGLAEPQWPLAGPGGKAIWPPAELRPAVRTYSLRRHDAAAGTFDVDFVLHGDEGIAGRWAARARPGDMIGVGGPGGRTIEPASRYLFVGDHSALPAIATLLERLPAAAHATCVVEVPDRGEEQPLPSAAALEVIWLHRDGGPPGEGTRLVDTVRGLGWPPGADGFAWIAGESASVRALKAYAREELGLEKRRMLAIGYWKRGMDETAYDTLHDHDR